MDVSSGTTFFINYTESFDYKSIANICREQFPDYMVISRHWVWRHLLPGVKVKKSFCVSARIYVNHNPKRGKTQITLYGNCDFLAFCLGGVIWHYLVRGDFLNTIKEGLIRGLKEHYGDVREI